MRRVGTMAEKENEGVGFLTVAVKTASDALPIEGALVTVTSIDENGNSSVKAQLYTQNSGRTEVIILEAPPGNLSEMPGVVRPYAIYNIEVDAEGFYSESFAGVPIFEGIYSEQPVEMIPISVSGVPQNGLLFNESPPPLL